MCDEKDDCKLLYKRFMEDYFLTPVVIRYVDRPNLSYEQVFMIVKGALLDKE